MRAWLRADRWIGRHMSPRKWVGVWVCVGWVGGLLLLHGWWMFLGVPMIVVGVVMAFGNVRRVR